MPRYLGNPRDDDIKMSLYLGKPHDGVKIRVHGPDTKYAVYVYVGRASSEEEAIRMAREIAQKNAGDECMDDKTYERTAFWTDPSKTYFEKVTRTDAFLVE